MSAIQPPRPSSRASLVSNSDSDVESSSEGYVSDAADSTPEEEPTPCPLCTSTLPNARATFIHLKDPHSYDFFAEKRRLGLDFYGGVKLVNWLRREGGKAQKDGAKVEMGKLTLGELEDETLLKPVVEGDPLILGLDEEEELEGGDEVEGLSEAEKKIRQLQEELEKVKEQFDAYKEVVAEEFRKELGERLKVKEGEEDWRKPKKRDDDSHYFESYSHNDIHEVMLKDTTRTDAYRDFIYGNKHLFAGKVVLDVGCGTGVLSMFCAKAGAAHVYAVDNSAIIDKAHEHVIANGLQNQITLIRGKVEEITLPVDKVDVIVSEWMGYCLLYEAMLDSVLFARDKWLVEGGLMVPSHTSIQITPINSEDYINDSYNFWNDVYGFNMSAMKRPIYEVVDIRTLTSEVSLTKSLPDAFVVLPHHTVSTKDLEFRKQFKAEISRSAESLDAFVISFETFFTNSPTREILPSDNDWTWPSRQPGEISFTTAMLPANKEEKGKREGTHWQQGVLPVLPEKNNGVKEGDVVRGEVVYVKSKDNSRELEIEVRWKIERGGEVVGEEKQKWKMQ